MAIDTAARRLSAMTHLARGMLLPDGAMDNVVDRYAILAKFYPIPPTQSATGFFEGGAAPRPRADVIPGPRPRARRTGHQ